jgi:hypothetical protein
MLGHLHVLGKLNPKKATLINCRNFGSRLVSLLRKLLLLSFEGEVGNKNGRGCDITNKLNLQQVYTLQFEFVGEYDFNRVVCWLF